MLLATDPAETQARPHSILLWELAESDALPPSENTFERLVMEANGLLAAGFETTASILTCISISIRQAYCQSPLSKPSPASSRSASNEEAHSSNGDASITEESIAEQADAEVTRNR